MRAADDPVLAAFRAECARQLGPDVGVRVPRALRVYRASLQGAVGPAWATDSRRPTVAHRDTAEVAA